MPATGGKPRHFLQFKDFSCAETEHVFERTRWIKDSFKRYERYWPLEDRTLVMIFEKASTRTRLSFEAGMQQLGGSSIFLNTRDTQLGRGEPVEDAAQVISRMSDAVMIRTYEQDIVERFAAHSRVPVVNTHWLERSRRCTTTSTPCSSTALGSVGWTKKRPHACSTVAAMRKMFGKRRPCGKRRASSPYPPS